jgi:Domain of unknown function (DUF1883)
VNYIKFPLKYQPAGAVVEATLAGVESDVFLVDPSNLSALEQGRNFSFHGDHYKQSPVRLIVPSSGDWTAVVIPGPGGTVRASVRTF